MNLISMIGISLFSIACLAEPHTQLGYGGAKKTEKLNSSMFVRHNHIPAPAVRFIASAAESTEEDAFWYYTQNKESKAVTVEIIDIANWVEGKSGFRWDYLHKMYFANTRSRSIKGHTHAACYTGSGTNLLTKFFKNDLLINNIKFVDTYNTEDDRAVGITYQFSDPNNYAIKTHHFRIYHCKSSGKNNIINIDPKKIVRAKPGTTDWSFLKEYEDQPSRDTASEENSLVALQENGFLTYDKLSSADVVAAGTKLPRYQIKADFDKIKINEKIDRPWKDMDISTPEGAEKFALMLQKYFYEGMIDQNKSNPNMNFIAQKNKVRDWCHMPWLNVGDRGRDAIHGLTKEMDLEPSPIYPEAANPANPESMGSNWGVGYYNSYACKTIGNVFGTPENPVAEPSIKNETTQFADGSVSAKILFSTAQFKALEGSLQLKANVSLEKQTARALRDVTHLQMDIAVKDSTLKGTHPEANHWVMITYYYDKDYTLPKDFKFSKAMSGLKHMRPAGIQVGFIPEHTTIFAGAKTNQVNGSLNGPADNPESSCMSCHAAAGTRLRMSPGATSFAEYLRVKAPALDFSQQFALARRNYQTMVKAKKE